MTNNQRSQDILERHQTPRMLAKEDKFYFFWTTVSLGIFVLAIIMAAITQ